MSINPIYGAQALDFQLMVSPGGIVRCHHFLFAGMPAGAIKNAKKGIGFKFLG